MFSSGGRDLNLSVPEGATFVVQTYHRSLKYQGEHWKASTMESIPSIYHPPNNSNADSVSCTPLETDVTLEEGEMSGISPSGVIRLQFMQLTNKHNSNHCSSLLIEFS